MKEDKKSIQDNQQSRRDFIKKVTAGTAGIAVGSSAMGMSASSYGRIIGANDRINIARPESVKRSKSHT